MSDEDFAVLHSTLSPVVNPDSEQVTISLPHDHSLPPSLPPFLPHSLTNSLTPSLPSIYRAGKNRQMHPSLTSYEQRWLRALRTSQVGWNIVCGLTTGQPGGLWVCSQGNKVVYSTCTLVTVALV